jgi:DnaK suppressor protein
MAGRAKDAAAKPRSSKPAAKKPAAKKPTATVADPTALVVRADEEPWTKEELREVRDVLQAESDRLRAEITEAEADIADLLRDGVDVGGEDQADTGSKTFEREHEMSLAASHREMLTQTERALGRIENGTYGVCESCGNPIGKARLQAFPRATLCMTCKQREERR